MKKTDSHPCTFLFFFQGFSQESFVVILNENPVVLEMEGDNDRQNQSKRNVTKRNQKFNQLDSFISEKRINAG